MDSNSATSVEAINEVVRTYAQGLDDADLGRPAHIWATDDEVSFIHPRGHERSWEQVRRNFYDRTMFERFATRQLHVHDVTIRVYEDAAWVEFQATFRSDGSPLTTRGREMKVCRKADPGRVLGYNPM